MKNLPLLVAAYIIFLANSYAIAPSSGSTDSFLGTQESLTSSINDFVSINDPVNGDFQIEKNLVTIQQYTDFLNAIAVTKDLHHLYTDEMKSVITYHPEGWIEGAYYSIVKNQGNQPMIFITEDIAMHYCNWKEWGAPSADKTGKIFNESGNDVTETGAYDFSTTNDEETIAPHLGSTYQLPTPNQLITALPKIVIPLNRFYEWTLSEESAAPAADDNLQDNMSLQFLLPCLVDDQKKSVVTTLSATIAPRGFRIIKNQKALCPESTSGINNTSAMQTLDDSQNSYPVASSSLSSSWYSWLKSLTPLETVALIAGVVIVAITVIGIIDIGVECVALYNDPSIGTSVGANMAQFEKYTIL